MAARRLELLLCSTDPTLARRASGGGLDGVIVDWELDEPIPATGGLTATSRSDLAAMRSASKGLLVARINRLGPWTSAEVDAAAAGGADEVLVPMIRSAPDVLRALEHAEGRCRVGIVVETLEAIEALDELAGLPLSRVHIGLIDLAAARGSSGMFDAVRDGLAETIARAFRVPVGFGGVTVADGGDPIPCRLLLGEMARVGCGFAMLGASFHRDVAGRDPAAEVLKLKDALAAARDRTELQIREDRLALEAVLDGVVAAR